MALAVRVIAQSLQRWITGHSRTITKDLVDTTFLDAQGAKRFCKGRELVFYEDSGMQASRVREILIRALCNGRLMGNHVFLNRRWPL